MSRTPAARTRFQTEMLEDRSVPALLSGLGSGLFHLAASPTATVDARADVIVNAPVVTADLTARVGGLLRADLGVNLNPSAATQPGTLITLNLLGHETATVALKLPDVQVDVRLGLWAKAGLSPDCKVKDVFPSCKYHPYGGLTLGACVNLTGGGINLLLKNAVTALVNARAGTGYPCTDARVVAAVDAAVTANVYGTINTLGGLLGGWNAACGATAAHLSAALKVNAQVGVRVGGLVAANVSANAVVGAVIGLPRIL